MCTNKKEETFCEVSSLSIMGLYGHWEQAIKEKVMNSLKSVNKKMLVLTLTFFEN